MLLGLDPQSLWLPWGCSQRDLCWPLRRGVNFIQIFWGAFSCKSVKHNFYAYKVCVCIFLANKKYQEPLIKCRWNWLQAFIGVTAHYTERSKFFHFPDNFLYCCILAYSYYFVLLHILHSYEMLSYKMFTYKMHQNTLKLQ